MQKSRLKQFVLATMVLLVLSFGLLSCGKDKKWNPDRHMIRIEKDKPVSQALFFESGIDGNLKNELYTDIKTKIEEYNNKYGKDSVFVISPKEKQSADQLDSIILGYDSLKEFGRFNDYSVFDGHIYEVEDFGFDIKQDYFKVSDGKLDTSRTVGIDKIDLDGCRILVLDPAIQPHGFHTEEESAASKLNYVEVAGADIIYATKNILVVDESVATINMGEKELGYIIYK